MFPAVDSIVKESAELCAISSFKYWPNKYLPFLNFTGYVGSNKLDILIISINPDALFLNNNIPY